MKKSINESDREFNFQAVYKSLFFIERSNGSVPMPSHNYHYHNCYELCYLYSGKQYYYFIKDKTYHVEEGSLVLIKPYEIHYTSNFSKCSYDRLLINFKEDFIKDLLPVCKEANPLKCFDKSIHAIVLTPKEKQFIESLLEIMISENDKEDLYHNPNIKFSLMQLLLFIGKNHLHSTSDMYSYVNSTHKTISEAVVYINNHYNENITLDTISNLFYISPYYFSRTFKKVCGISFIEYLNNVRIKEARKLLYKTDLNITCVAESVGFGSNTHFNRIFKSLTGMSPRAYRKATKNNK